jgi:hypothetical protein
VHELLQTAAKHCGVRFDCFFRAEHFLLKEVADVPVGFVTDLLFGMG